MMFFEQQTVIKETYYAGATHVPTALPVAYGVDRNFLLGSVVSMVSLLINNPDSHFAFHLFTDYFDDDFKLKIQQLSQQSGAEITVYLVDCDELKKLPSTKNWSYAMYFRFLALDFIDTNQDRVLYLDADVVCKKTIHELRQINLDNYLAAVVKDGDSTFWQERAAFFNVPEMANGYFNSGVMLVNIRNWRKNRITEQAMAMLSNPEIQKKLTFPDQDVLNILLCQDIFYLNRAYNSQTSINFELQCQPYHNYPHCVSDETIFIHYVGPTKPWHIWATYPISDYFMSAKNRSPWRDHSLIKAHSKSLLRYQAKHHLHQKKYVQGLCKYLAYFYAKLKKSTSA